MSTKDLIDTLPQRGELIWIGLRPARRTPMRIVSQTMAEPGHGLIGDRFHGRPTSRRQVTLVQAEHLPVIAALLDAPDISPEQLRRNLVVSRINLLALKNRRFRIGEALFEGTGACAPCSRMEEAFGSGGYNAVRGHGGITAQILEGGIIRLGDPVMAA